MVNDVDGVSSEREDDGIIWDGPADPTEDTGQEMGSHPRKQGHSRTHDSSIGFFVRLERLHLPPSVLANVTLLHLTTHLIIP